MRHNLLLLVYIFVLSSAIYAQETTLTAELRPRAEYRNGYRGLTNDGKALGLISQRSGLNFSYKDDKLDVGIGIRDVRTWGQSGTLELNSGTTVINEAWAEIHMNKVFSVKVGRQALLYGDGRILATNNWNQLGRFHDAVVFKMENDSLFTLHLGGAYNHNQSINPVNPGLDLYTVNNYKAMFFGYLKKDIEAARIELIYLGNGMQDVVDSTTHFSHTGGIRVSKTKGKFKPEASFYYQGGVNTNGQDVRAFMGTVSATYKINAKWGLQLGSDYISGQDYVSNGGTVQENSTDRAFDLLYGFRHKYYGHQDYFFIGSNTNYGLGFSDTYLKVDYTTENKWNIYVTVHQFLSGNDIMLNGESQSKNLATEIDLGFSYPISNNVKVMGGYSQILATNTLGALEKADYRRNNNWVWLQLNITPTLFTWKKEAIAGM